MQAITINEKGGLEFEGDWGGVFGKFEGKKQKKEM